MPIAQVVGITAKQFSTSKRTRDFCQLMLEKMRENFERDGVLLPFACVITTKHPNTGERLRPYMAVFIEGRLREPQDKDAFAHEIDLVAAQGEAMGVFLGAEAWTVEFKDRTQGVEAIDEYQGDFSKHPDRVEVVTASFDHQLYGRFHYQAKITRTEGKVELGPFVESHYDVSEGRFASLVRPAKPKGNA